VGIVIASLLSGTKQQGQRRPYEEERCRQEDHGHCGHFSAVKGAGDV
jgi:hypothetical protein